MKKYNVGAYGIPGHVTKIVTSIYCKEMFKSKINYSAHALAAFLDDRFKAPGLMLPLHWPNKAELVEVETNSTGPKKAVFRISLSSTLDLVLVVALDTLTVKTVWINLKSDTHNTLNKSNYNKL